MTRRKQLTIPFHSKWYQVWEYVLLLVGAVILALAFNLLLNPNQIASGGVAAISTIIQHTLGYEPAITQWVINIPLFVAGLFLLGKRFGVKTAVGTVFLPLIIYMTRDMEPLTDQLLLAAIYGGIGLGLGLGLVFRGRASTGGLDLAAQIVHKYTGLSLAVCIALLDGLVILSAGILLSPERAMYGLIALFVTSKTINIVQMGFSYSKVAFIITEQTEQVRQAILHELDRGLTTLSGQGGFTDEARPVLMVVMGQREISKLKMLVSSVDPKAFIVISDAHEVLGEGFKRPRQ